MTQADDKAQDRPERKSEKGAEPRPRKKRPAERTAAKTQPRRRLSGARVAVEAVRQLAELTGKEIEGVVGLDRNDEGWIVQVEVLELRRVPSTTDMLATYDVHVDERGDLEGYQRLARYVRGTPGEE